MTESKINSLIAGLLNYNPECISKKLIEIVQSVICWEQKNERWLGVKVLPVVAIIDSIKARDSAGYIMDGDIIYGETVGGRDIMAFNAGSSTKGWQSQYLVQSGDSEYCDTFSEDIKVSYPIVFVSMDKNPNDSTFASNACEFGMGEWIILNNPEQI